MKIACNRAALYEAVQLASSIVPARTPKEILKCAKIQADKESQTVIVMATDNEITVKYTIPQVQVDDGGSTVLPADRIASILHESSDETVNLELTDATCEVVGKDSRFRIYGHDPDDYPAIAITPPEGVLQIQAAVLKRMIHMTSFAAARENTRYAINGVLWEQQGKKLRLVATDGRRLAKMDGTTKSKSSDDNQTAIVPGKTMQVVERILHDPEEQVQISFPDNKICINTALVQVLSNLVQGRFPKYSDVIPEGHEKKIKINRELLSSGVRRVALLANEQSKGILLSFSNESLCLTSSTPEAGEAEIRMPVEYQGEEFKIGFNPQYILEALRVVEELDIVFELSDPGKPGVIKAGKDFLYVLMPVTV
ncbi:MAG: DNA polymerase III subunit beta [Sedimentisphaerales bacterium]|nr:DNA polymerase III subunit beta [Sedimentisphaerales bacterium]